MAVDKPRCSWVNANNEAYIYYHDNEWGRAVKEEKKLLEMLILELFQGGLSFECVLNKRAAFKSAFADYNEFSIINFTENKIEQLFGDSSIIRNKAKIKAAINNTGVFAEIQKEYGSFAAYLNCFTQGKIIYEQGKISNKLSDDIAGDLQKRGMKFIGSKMIYAYLQAIGIIYAHEENCFLAYVGNKKDANYYN